MIDAPIETPTGTPAVRSAPIRVQVTESGEAAPPKPRPAQLLPEDMSGLLDAFADPLGEEAPPPAAAEPAPAVEAPRAIAAKPASPLAGDDEDFSGLLDSMAPTAPEREPEPEPEPPAAAALEPEPPAVSLEDALEQESRTLAPGKWKAPHFEDDRPPLEVEDVVASEAATRLDEDVALDTLLDDADPEPEPEAAPDDGAKTLTPGRMKAPVFEDDLPPMEAAAVPPPPPPPEKLAIPPTDLDQLLEGVFAPAASAAQAGGGEEVPGLGELLKAVPKPASRTATKFQAAAPKIAPAGESRMMLDLASLAEDAFTLPPPRESTVAAHATGVGDEFGPYQLVEKVATGGMAEVFRAKRSGVEGFEKVVALKRILPHLSDNKEFVDLFIDEAKMVAGLTHPNIVQIFDLGKIDDTYFIAMEYVHGHDLRTILRRAKDKGIRIPLDLCVFVIGRVAAALEYAHRKKDEAGRPLRIVHRDVSPQNILIAFEGEVKLTDFGIAKATSKATSTDRGALRGKLLYMSPEQATGKAMDKRADVFSLGVCFYEMITDRKPFMGTSEKSILEMVRECRISPPSMVNPRIPERIEKVVMKALDRDPEQRYQDAGEMLRDLERALQDRQPPTALELSRFMEVLFERDERGDTAPPDADVVEEAVAPLEDRLEIDLEEDELGLEEPLPSAPAEPPPAKAPEQAGFGRLLKKFGIK